MPTKRRTRTATPDQPITGVAAGSLGTAANLDDTQVMRTEDLRAAAAAMGSPAWLAEAPPPAAISAEPIAPDEPPVPQTPPEWTPSVPAPVSGVPAAAVPAEASPAAAAPTAPIPVVTPRPTPRAPGASGRNVPRLAAAAAFILLLVIAGAGFFSQLDFSTATGPGLSFGAETAAPPSDAPRPKPEAAKGAGAGGGGAGHGPKRCHGHGHGHDCGDGD